MIFETDLESKQHLVYLSIVDCYVDLEYFLQSYPLGEKC
ncbi:hypothetical protein ENHY17A_450004 [Moraxellaceae bacterium 17A]|nr:hypothetical protein ENHY17A_450004 [Moraxellaceae bacterium 17A]